MIPARPCGSNELTGITTQGVNGTALIPTGAADPWITPTQVKVYVSAKAYVCFGAGSTADTSPPARKAVQQAGTEETYALTGYDDPVYTYIWIYSLTSTIAADVSWFG